MPDVGLTSIDTYQAHGPIVDKPHIDAVSRAIGNVHISCKGEITPSNEAPIRSKMIKYRRDRCKQP